MSCTARADCVKPQRQPLLSHIHAALPRGQLSQSQEKTTDSEKVRGEREKQEKRLSQSEHVM